MANMSSTMAGPRPTNGRAGGTIPKLQACVPFTPVTGPRLLLHPDAGPEAADLLIAALVGVAKRRKVSSLHVTFPTESEAARLGEAGFLQRIGRQFHWENEGYRTFDDFLDALNSRKRKQIRRERRDALAGGLEIETLTGSALETRHWDAFFRFYMSTSDRKWGSAYLTREFFDLLGSGWPTGSRWSWRGRGTAMSRARSIWSARTRSMAATGAATATSRSSISRRATTAPSTSRSRAA